MRAQLCRNLPILLALALTPAAWAETTSRVSVSSAERQARGGSSQGSSVSADGRYVAFTSHARNLAPHAARSGAVLLRDRLRGTTRTASLTARGRTPDGPVIDFALSANGRFVAFSSSADNIVDGDTNRDSFPGDDGEPESEPAADIFVRDLARGTTRRVSVGPRGRQADEASSAPAISAGGRYVAFASDASNLVRGDDNGVTDIFLRDRRRGATRRVTGGDEPSFEPSVSADGRHVAYTSGGAVFVADLEDRTTARIAPGDSPVLTPDASRLAFASQANDLVPGDTNQHSDPPSDESLPPDVRAASDVFVRDLRSGTTRRVSVGSTGAQAGDDSVTPAISADGRFVAFTSFATNLVAGDDNGLSDVYVHDTETGRTRRVSLGSTGSGSPSVSAHGRHVAFESVADDLVAGDTNRQTDVFVRLMR